jgi:hypothetical protein
MRPMQSTRTHLAVAACTLLSAFSARAEPPAGSFALTIGGPDSPTSQMRLLEGVRIPANACNNTNPTVEICEETEVHTDAAGDVTGAIRFTYTGTTQGVIEFLIDGTLKAAPGIAKSKLIFTPQGTLQVDGVGPSVVSGLGKGYCRDDITTGESFTCDSKIRLCFEDAFVSDCDRFFDFYEFAEQQAPWAFEFDLVTDERGLVTGSGLATLANGVEVEFTAKGKYKSKSDLSNVTFTGLGLGRKSKILIKGLQVVEGALFDGRVKFKVAAQSGVYEIPLPPP